MDSQTWGPRLWALPHPEPISGSLWGRAPTTPVLAALGLLCAPPCLCDAIRGSHARVCVLVLLAPQKHLSSHSCALVYKPRFSRQAPEVVWVLVPFCLRNPKPVPRAPAPSTPLTLLMYTSIHGHRGLPGPPCPSRLLVSCVSVVLSCVNVRPRPVTLGTNSRVFPGARRGPCSHSAISLQGQQGEGGCSVTRMYGLLIFNGPFSLRICTLWNIKQFVIEAGGFLLACLPAAGPPLHSPDLSPPPDQADNDLSGSPIPLITHGKGQISFLAHPRAARHLLASPYLPPNDRKRAPQMGHLHAQLSLCLIIKRASPGEGTLRLAGYGLGLKRPVTKSRGPRVNRLCTVRS